MTYRQLPKTMYTDIRPTPVADPELVVFNDALADELGLDPERWANPLLLAGNVVPEDLTPIALAYLGHQFGYLAVLGDGRAILLAEETAPGGERFDIQLKGSGRTPYSRGGDGRAALGPMLREYLISEAMHALGIPTSRSLAVVKTGEPVYREKPYPGAVLARVASSHLRVGTLQYALHRGVVREVAEYTMERHDPQCREEPHPFLCLFQSILARQAELIARWQAFGFIHGVMNTDNMALSGETIDYGPCAFMDTYRSNQYFSSIDRAGRYRYGNQPFIAKWNLARLAETLTPLLHRDENIAIDRAIEVLNTFDELHGEAWLKSFGAKLGLPDPLPDDRSLIEDFLRLLEAQELDFTNSFLALSEDPQQNILTGEEGDAWYRKWRARTGSERPEAVSARMLRRNPRVIPRNLKLDAVLREAEEGSLAPFHKMLRAVQHPFAAEAPEEYTVPAPPGERFVSYCGT